MPLETATYISGLNSANPAHSDQLNQADAHLRLLKSTLQATFPNVNAAVTATPAQLNGVAGLTGLVSAFLATTSDPNWLRLNGGSYAQATYPALAAMLGIFSGTFTLPNMEDTGRFPRSVRTGVAALTLEANLTATHTHNTAVTLSGTTSGESAPHTHGATSTVTDPGHTHTYNTPQSISTYSPGGVGPASGPLAAATGASVTGITVATTLGLESVGHTHSWSGSGTFGSDAVGGAETRPEAISFIYYVHI